MKTSVITLFVIVTLALCISVAGAEVRTSTSYKIYKDVIDNSGGRSTSTSYINTFTVGDSSAIGTSTSTSYINNAGFLGGGWDHERGLMCVTVYINGYWTGSSWRTDFVDILLFDASDTLAYSFIDVPLDGEGQACADLWGEGVATGSYSVVVGHFNHLDLYSAGMYTLSGDVRNQDIDFSDPTEVACGAAAMIWEVSDGGVYCMRAGDAFSDGQVNIFDYADMGNNWGTSAPSSDYNGDGTINIMDYALLGQNWGQSECGFKSAASCPVGKKPQGELQFRLVPFDTDEPTLSNVHGYQLQMRSTAGYVDIGAFQLDLNLHGLKLVEIDTDSYIGSGEMSIDWSDDNGDGTVTIFRAAAIDSQDIGIEADKGWATYGDLYFSKSAAPSSSFVIEVDYFSAVTTLFVEMDTVWVSGRSDQSPKSYSNGF